jgi:hypothetical protein
MVAACHGRLLVKIVSRLVASEEFEPGEGRSAHPPSLSFQVRARLEAELFRDQWMGGSEVRLASYVPSENLPKSALF